MSHKNIRLRGSEFEYLQERTFLVVGWVGYIRLMIKHSYETVAQVLSLIRKRVYHAQVVFDLALDLGWMVHVFVQ